MNLSRKPISHLSPAVGWELLQKRLLHSSGYVAIAPVSVHSLSRTISTLLFTQWIIQITDFSYIRFLLVFPSFWTFLGHLKPSIHNSLITETWKGKIIDVLWIIFSVKLTSAVSCLVTNLTIGKPVFWTENDTIIVWGKNVSQEICYCGPQTSSRDVSLFHRWGTNIGRQENRESAFLDCFSRKD